MFLFLSCFTVPNDKQDIQILQILVACNVLLTVAPRRILSLL